MSPSLDTAQSDSNTCRLDISVAICTCKRLPLLRDSIESLLQQQVSQHLNWEILVIDNDVVRSAEPIVKQIAVRTKQIVRYIHESTPGLSCARNRAIRECRGKIIAFLDDDVLVPPNWLNEMCEIFRADECGLRRRKSPRALG